MDLESEVLRLRRLGKSGTKIHHELKESYGATRRSVRKILIAHDLMDPNSTYGGYRSGSGKGQKFLLDGVIYDSYAEICFFLKYKDSGIRKNTRSFRVGDHNYTPDFVDPAGNYYEVKSSNADDMWGWNKLKLKDFPLSLVVISHEDIKRIVAEIESQYDNCFFDSHRWQSSWRGTQVVEECCPENS